MHLLSIQNDMGNTPLHEASYQGMSEAAEALLRAGAPTETRNDDSKGGITPLLAAVEFGKLTTVRVLLLGGADPHTMPTVPTALFRRQGDVSLWRSSNPRAAPNATRHVRPPRAAARSRGPMSQPHHHPRVS